MFKPGKAVEGAHQLTAVVENLATGLQGSPSSVYNFNIYTALPVTIMDDVGSSQTALVNNAITDDATPTLSGSLITGLLSSEELAIYDTVNGVTSKLGTAIINGLTWSYTPEVALADGSHVLMAAIQARGSSDVAKTHIASSSTTIVVDTNPGVPSQAVNISTLEMGAKARYIMLRFSPKARSESLIARIYLRLWGL
ncbi:hypothetical protein [Methylobacillus glycogenes]|uniref:hypothetical protein n=1 Tax=Methylobacillus glycogenes TaxID=406 RepID=UPI000472E5FF|nr:hypothetical protein [Methylobacillus glycogenes]